jgi:hypothetical protein
MIEAYREYAETNRGLLMSFIISLSWLSGLVIYILIYQTNIVRQSDLYTGAGDHAIWPPRQLHLTSPSNAEPERKGKSTAWPAITPRNAL